MSDAQASLRHPACTCRPDVPEGAYSMDCAHHLAAYEPTHIKIRSQLDVDAVNEILARRRYRPGWTLRAYVGDTTRLIHVDIDAMVEDSYNPGQQTRLHIVSPVPPYVLDDEMTFDKWLAHRLIMIEAHESAEWYRKTGRDLPWVPVFNPHRDGADRDQWPIVKRGR